MTGIFCRMACTSLALRPISLSATYRLQLRHGETNAHHSNRRREKGNGTPATSPDGDGCDQQHTYWQRARQKVKPHRLTGQRGNAVSRPWQNIDIAQPADQVTAFSQSSPPKIGNAPAQTEDALAAMQQAQTLPWFFSRAPTPAAPPHAHPVRPTQPIQWPQNYGLSARPGGVRSHLHPNTHDYQGHSHGSLLPPFRRELQNPRNLPFHPPIQPHWTTFLAVLSRHKPRGCYMWQQGSRLLQMPPQGTPSQNLHSIANVAWQWYL